MSRLRRNLLHLISGTLVSRGLGFVRELVAASVFGASTAMDLFVVALTIPTFFRRILGEDVVERAFMPPFKAALTRGDHAGAWRLLAACLNWMVLAAVLLTAGLYLVTPVIIGLLAPGLAPELVPAAIRMTYWILPFTVIIALAAFVGGLLNIFELNRPFSFAPAMLSVGVIAGIYCLEPVLGMYALPAGYLLGAAGQLLVQLPFCRHRVIRDSQPAYRATLATVDPAFRKVWTETRMLCARSGIDKSVEIADRVLASFLASGSISALWFAQRLLQLPLAVFGLAIGRALTPYLTEKHAEADDSRLVTGIDHGILLNLTLLLPATAGGIALAPELVRAVFGRGAFDASAIGMTVAALVAYLVGLPAMGVNSLLMRVFSVRQENRFVLKVGWWMALVNIGLGLLLVRTPLRHAGLALASSAAFAVSALMLYRELSRVLPGLPTARLLGDAARLSLATAAAAGAGYLCRHAVGRLLPGTSVWESAVHLGAGGLTVLLVYAAGLCLVGPPRVRSFLLRRRGD
jgi:putative peptidoglycan lipid II flippase